MSKKKVSHKGKPKHACEETEEFGFRRNIDENTEEEYTTVVDFEVNKKYSKRLIESNWSKYESTLSDFDCGDENEPLKPDDFDSLLKTASSDCTHFQFNSEKLWNSAHNSVPPSNIFNLDLNILSSGLACIPFYERMGLDGAELSAEDKKRLDKEAEISLKQYNAMREKLVKKPDDDIKGKNLESSLHTVQESMIVKFNLPVNGDQKNKDSQNDSIGGSPKEVEKCDKSAESDTTIGKTKQKIFLSDNDENLEDWLDSVLDD